MNTPKSLQIQAVLYQNELCALERSLSSLANAARQAQKRGILGAVTLVWGDASPVPLLSAEKLDALEQRQKQDQGQSPLHLSYRFFDENTGYGKGHNRLFANCNSDYLLILNPDVVVAYDFFENMLAPFADASVGLTEARQTPVEHPKSYDEKSGETPWASGACFIVPTSLYRTLGGFDEAFFMYCEDMDLSFRIRQAEKKLIYCPTAPVYHSKHFNGRNGELERTVTEMRFSVESLLILAYKWRKKRLVSYFRSVYQGGDEYQRAGLAAFEKKRKQGVLSQVHGNTKVFQKRYLKNRYSL